MDAHDWLMKHRPPHFVSEPSRMLPASEVIGAGDVLEDGSLMSLHGVIVSGGDTAVYLIDKKRCAAQYYGWRYDPNYPNGYDDEGRPTYPMRRPLPR